MSIAETLESRLLAGAIYQSDGKALETLEARYGARMKRYVASRIDSPADAEDIVQDVFVGLLEKRGHYNGHRGAEKYLLGIARHLIYQYHRDKGKQAKVAHLDTSREAPDTHSVQPVSGPARRISQEQLKKALEEVMNRLPPKAYEAIKLRFMEGFSSKQAAKKAGCSVEAFYQRVRRARKGLQELRQDDSNRI